MAFKRYCLAGQGIQVDEEAGVAQLWLVSADDGGAESIVVHLAVVDPPESLPEDGETPTGEPDPIPVPEPSEDDRRPWRPVLPPAAAPAEPDITEPAPAATGKSGA